MTEQLRIAYKLIGAGWSECTLEAGDTRAEITASYLSDALGNLVLSAVAVGSGFGLVAFGFDEEPGEYRWVLQTIENNVVRLRILEFPQLWGYEPNEKGRCVLEVVTTPLAFAKAVQICAASVLQEYGAQGYAEKWVSHPFPERELALLDEVVLGRGR
jgi:hypothetical protein